MNETPETHDKPKTIGEEVATAFAVSAAAAAGTLIVFGGAIVITGMLEKRRQKKLDKAAIKEAMKNVS